MLEMNKDKDAVGWVTALWTLANDQLTSATAGSTFRAAGWKLNDVWPDLLTWHPTGSDYNASESLRGDSVISVILPTTFWDEDEEDRNWFDSCFDRLQNIAESRLGTPWKKGRDQDEDGHQHAI